MLRCKVHENEELLKPILRIKINAERCTFDIKRTAKEIVSEKYNLKEYALCFKGIKQGCIELLFHISEAVMTHILQYKITGITLAEFSACKIISIHINDVDILVSS